MALAKTIYGTGKYNMCHRIFIEGNKIPLTRLSVEESEYKYVGVRPYLNKSGPKFLWEDCSVIDDFKL